MSAQAETPDSIIFNNYQRCFRVGGNYHEKIQFGNEFLTKKTVQNWNFQCRITSFRANQRFSAQIDAVQAMCRRFSSNVSRWSMLIILIQSWSALKFSDFKPGVNKNFACYLSQQREQINNKSKASKDE